MSADATDIWLVERVLIERDSQGWYQAYCCLPDCQAKTASADRVEIDNWIKAHKCS